MNMTESRIVTPYAVVFARIFTVPGRRPVTTPVVGSTLATVGSAVEKKTGMPSIGVPPASFS